MELASTPRRAAAAASAFAASAALLYFGNGLYPQWPLMWLAPVPVLLFGLGKPAWQAALAAAAAWLAGSANLWDYTQAVSLPATAWLIFSGMGAAAFAAGVLLTCALHRRGALWSAWLALPALWVSFEYLRNLAGGSIGSVAYSQLSFLPFLQWASVTGPWGMAFVLMLLPAGLAIGLHEWGKDRRKALQVAGTALAVTAAVLLFGALRLQGSQPGPELTVGLAASDTKLPAASPGAAAQRLFTQYAQTAQQLTARGAQVVVLPEAQGVVRASDVAQTDGIFQAAADRTGAVLVAGVAYAASNTLQHNEARIYQPGARARSYDKEHLLAPLENQYTPGTTRTLLEAPGKGTRQPWGVAICKDFDFTEPARAYGRSGVGLMLAPAWDFRIDEAFHGHIAVMRAVEDGFSLVRAAKNGFLTVADDRGRIVAEASSNTAPFATLLAQVRTGHDQTLFLLFGDWFGGFALALLAIVMARVFWLTKTRASVLQLAVARMS